MTPFRSSAAALVISLLAAAPLGAQTLLDTMTSNINIEGMETTFDPETGVATATGNVRIKYGDTEIVAGKAEYNSNTGDVKANQNVTVWKAGVIYQGESIVYNVKTSDLTGDTIQSGMGVRGGNIFYTTEKFETETKFIDRIDGGMTYLTTHDYADPNYRVKAREMTIYPDDRIIMKRVTVYAGDTPVFWLPYLSQPIDDEVGYRFTPGYSDLWGAFLLNQYGMIHGDHTLAKYHFDLRSARGVAGGADFISLRHKDNQHNFGTLKFYVAQDNDSRASIAGDRPAELDDVRYRVNFQHRIYLPGPAKSTWYLDFDINKMSDIHFYEDFFFEDFRTNREPDNQVSLVHTDPRYTATLMARFRLNDFYLTDTRLPEIAFDFTRQPLWNSGVFYQGNTSFGIYTEEQSDQQIAERKALIDSTEAYLKTLDPLTGKPLAGAIDPKTGLPATAAIDPETGLPSTAPIDQAQYRKILGLPDNAAIASSDVERALDILRSQTDSVGFNRIHSYHEFLYPKTFAGWLNVVPRIGGGFTNYSSVDGGSDETKGILHAGLDVSFKISKSWDDVRNEALGLDGFRHMIRPYLNYSYLNADDPEDVPSIDRLSPTTRARTIDVPLFTAVDDLRSWNIARVGVQNLFQTRRDYTSYDRNISKFRTSGATGPQTYNWAGMNTYVDLFAEDPEHDRDISNLYNEMFWRPLPWLTVFSDTQLPIGSSEFNYTELNHGVTWLPTDRLSLTLSHQFITDHPLFEDSSLISSVIYARLSENWGFSMNHVYEIDDGTMQYQSYALHRDLSSWVMSLGGRLLDSGTGEGDFGVVLSFTLKDFPQVSLPLDSVQNPTGIGHGGF